MSIKRRQGDDRKARDLSCLLIPVASLRLPDCALSLTDVHIVPLSASTSRTSQIYNEQVRDLFGHGGSGHGLRVREHPTKGAFVEGLSARPVSCYQQVQRLLEDGMSAR